MIAARQTVTDLMSALGKKRTNHAGPKSEFVRFGPKADIRGCGRIVRFVPIADIPPFIRSRRRRARELLAEW
jgi:hypothetical protein